MTLQESEKRRQRTLRQEDDDESYYTSEKPEKRTVPEPRYTFRSTAKPRPPVSVHAKSFKLGDIVSTSEGPHKVMEVFWRSGTDRIGWRADVLLKPLSTDEIPAEFKRKSAKDRPRSAKDAKNNRLRKAYGG